MSKRVYSISEASEAIGLSAATLRRHIKSGSLTANRLGSKWLIPHSEIQRLTGEKVAEQGEER